MRSSRAGQGAQLSRFGYTVRDGHVFDAGELAGRLAGATAGIAGEKPRHIMTRVATGVGALTKRTAASLLISFADPAGRTRRIRPPAR